MEIFNLHTEYLLSIISYHNDLLKKVFRLSQVLLGAISNTIHVTRYENRIIFISRKFKKYSLLNRLCPF